MTEHEKLKEDYRKLNESYDKLTDTYNAERILNDELIEINRKVAEASNKTAETFIKYDSENRRMKEILKHGVFIEYDKDPKTMEFVPVLGDITKFTHKQKKPSKMMYSFTYESVDKWLKSLHDLMEGKKENIIKVDPNDLK